jgi:hypothetical protein
MFCDLVDLTGIAAKLDAEEWRDLVGAYIDAASAAVLEMGGKVEARRWTDGAVRVSGGAENDAEHLVPGIEVCINLAVQLARRGTRPIRPSFPAAALAVPTLASSSGMPMGLRVRRRPFLGRGPGNGRQGRSSAMD